MIDVQAKAGGVSFSVRVQPRASRTEITGEWLGALRVRLAAPPVDDEANEELRSFLAECLDVPVAAISIAHGQHGRSKRIEIRGATAEQVRGLTAPAAQSKSRQSKSVMKSATGVRSKTGAGN